ncbi:hypothetical protein ASPZODRAFT_156903 [Penicilliopsis zonata CBS 506.65]|uniref:Uncharacterized protein n=1 Tax=Penicilliopsis zonata CBS 506.65 TaxID=1073090 RepID=A0A1L9SRN0_9EURO|nr:hypothetical protein ASPZODRAFT_156903 [Penicilliopsis zonata CBS 506.65]OJJ49872.1 hypothetical protein ASPZODRAFT_156903 [Penicilliopsis zonata CBS 506.65]
MQWLMNLLKSLYSLETLDTRFTRSTTESPSSARDALKLEYRPPLPDTKSSKWRTIEYYIYYLVFAVVIPTMVKQVYDISNLGSPDWDSFSKRLSRGWIPVILEHRTLFDVGFGVIFLIALHGVSAAKVVLIFYANFKIATRLPRSYVPVATWVFNLGTLFANEFCRGYPLAKHVDAFSERDRVSHGAALRDFNLKTYLAYTLYSPLYLAGPILSFNDFVFQSRNCLPTTTTARTSLYGLRFLLALLCMEVVLHYSYAVAIIKSSPSWAQYTPFQLAMLGNFNLHAVWLKLLIPWRFFRLWALVDGLDAPENMVRCMSDNYSTLAFWRGWHRSLNRWVVRYIYVPLGGNGEGSKVKTMVNILAVFTFIALWHDINLRLLAWGWLATLFILPEVIAMILFPKRKWRDWPETFRILCGIGAVGNILMMMAASLVGFVMGVDEVKEMVKAIFAGWSSAGFVTAAVTCLFVSAQIMFEHREGEKRQGINLKC